MKKDIITDPITVIKIEKLLDNYHNLPIYKRFIFRVATALFLLWSWPHSKSLASIDPKKMTLGDLRGLSYFKQYAWPGFFRSVFGVLNNFELSDNKTILGLKNQQISFRIKPLVVPIIPPCSSTENIHPSAALPNLESMLLQHLQRWVPVREENRKLDYRRPNEGTPESIQTHLKMDRPGIIVSTGTERSMGFLPFLSEQGNRENRNFVQGIVSCDLNPLVKRYNDYLILLLRLSYDQKDFLQLSRTPTWLRELHPTRGVNHSLEKETCKEHIQTRLNEDQSISDEMKAYYTTHLEALAEAYYEVQALPGSTPCALTGVNYLDQASEQSKAHFSCLQRFAREGKLVSVIGNINDLTWLENLNINMVDTSNIDCFEKVNPRYAPSQKTPPRLIWTQVCWISTLYFSKVFHTTTPMPTHLPRDHDKMKEEAGTIVTGNIQRYNMFAASRHEKANLADHRSTLGLDQI